MRAWGFLAALLCLFVAFESAPAIAAGSAPAGVSLARGVREALQRVSAESYTQVGFAYAIAEQAPQPVFRWRWGGGPVAGMVPVREQATIGLKEGRANWWRDDLTPLPCIEAALCGEVTGLQAPIELVLDAAGAFYAYGDQSSHGCFGRLGGSTPVSLGERTWTLFGEFAAPAAHGATELLDSSFPWGLTGGQASESTTVSTRTHLPVREQTTVVPAAAGGAPFSFTASYSYPARARRPRVTLCAAKP